MGAQERASQGSENAAAAQDRSADTHERASQANENASAAQEPASSAQDRAVAASPDGVAPGKPSSPGNSDAAGNGNGTANESDEPGGSRLALNQLLETYPEFLEATDKGPAVRGQIIAMSPEPAALARLLASGYRVEADELIPGIEVRSVTLATPEGKPLMAALAEVRSLAPGTEFAANHLHAQSASVAMPAVPGAALLQRKVGDRKAIGIIDGGVGAHPAILSSVEQRGFARGAPSPNPHATAVASLAVGAKPIHSAAPLAPLLVADVFGADPTGGNALALAKAIGWLTSKHVPVIVVSLVGPENALVRKAVEKSVAQGVLIIAPVGNDGPAAPPAYPANFDRVISVTGVDARNRLLIEASKAIQLDYAAPGADTMAADLSGRLVNVRGTSFAAPLVAGRLFMLSRAGANALHALDGEALDLGPKGPDSAFGRGLVCGNCRTTQKK